MSLCCLCQEHCRLTWCCAALQLHAWLEKTAFYKMPRQQEQELVTDIKKPFEEVRNTSHVPPVPKRHVYQVSVVPASPEA